MRTRDSVKRLSNGARSILFLLLAFLLGCSSAFAQGTSSSAVGGTITDQTGGLIKGASVTVANKANGQTRSATTNDSGEYKFDFLPAGRYDIKVSASGFGDAIAENVEILVGKTTSLDVSMSPGIQTANVTVTAGEAELVNREKTDISLNITP